MGYYYYVCILASKRNGTLYTGVTNNLLRRVYEHKKKIFKGFTSKYNVNKLVYFEQTDDIYSSIGREKQLKKYYRSWKIKLIEDFNPDWNDLYYEYGGTDDMLDEIYTSDTGFPAGVYPTLVAGRNDKQNGSCRSLLHTCCGAGMTNNPQADCVRNIPDATLNESEKAEAPQGTPRLNFELLITKIYFIINVIHKTLTQAR